MVAVRNAAATIQACLDSAIAQGPVAEVIVIDGGSTDGSGAVLKANAHRLAHWESRPDRGIYHAWNKALDHAAGEWVFFLGADDRFASSNVLSEVRLRLAALDPSIRVAYGRVRFHTWQQPAVVVGAPWPEVRAAFAKGMAIPHQGVFHRRSLFDRGGRFDERYRICGDYELLLREFRDHEPAFLDIVVADVGGAGISSRPESERVMRREFHRARHANGLTQVPEWLAPAVVRIEIRELLARTLGPRVARLGVRAYRWAAGRLRGRGE